MRFVQQQIAKRFIVEDRFYFRLRDKTIFLCRAVSKETPESIAEAPGVRIQVAGENQFVRNEAGFLVQFAGGGLLGRFPGIDMTTRQLKCDFLEGRPKLPNQRERSVSRYRKDAHVVLSRDGIMERIHVGDFLADQLEPGRFENWTPVGNVELDYAHSLMPKMVRFDVGMLLAPTSERCSNTISLWI